MKIFIEYIFLLKGLLISVRRLSCTLIMFERACKAVAKKSAVLTNHFTISIMASWEKATVQKMLSCWKSRGARSIQVQPAPVNALSGSSSTTQSFTVSGKSLGSKRSISDATNSDSTQEGKCYIEGVTLISNSSTHRVQKPCEVMISIF